MAKTKLWAILLVLLTTLLTSSAQILYKFGANKLVYSFTGIITNYQLLLGLFIYMVGAVIMIIALKGGDLSVLYPIIATSYIWVSLLSMFFFSEKITLFKWIGIFTIIIGIIFITKGPKEDALKYTEAV